MSACAIKRWGSGTPCVKEDTTGAKEMAEKLAKMQAEREKQDTMWLSPAESEEVALIQKKNSPPK